MKKATAIFLAAILTVLLLTGCSPLRSALSGISDKLDEFTTAGLVVRVTRVEKGGVKGRVVSGDSHFDEKDVVYVYYDQIAGTNGTNQIAVTDKITLSYDYATDVTLDGDIPVIRVEVVSLYVPKE